MKKLNINNHGQIVLILVLLTVVGLTIGLSLISRSITDVRITSQIEQSSRAFSAAEAGIETALAGRVEFGPTGSVSLPGATANYSVNAIGGNADPFKLPNTDIGETQTVWLIEHNADDTINESGYFYPVDSLLDICWGDKEGSFPAILVSIFYKDGNDYKLAKKAYDSQNRGNNFQIGDILGDYCSLGFRYKKTIVAGSDSDPNSDDFNVAPGSILILMRIQPLYEKAALAVAPSTNLPVQGKVITSIGQTETSVVRKIQVYQGYPVLPSLLDFTYFSEN